MLSTHHILLFPQFAEMDKPGEQITALVPRVPEMHEVGCNWGAGSEAEGDTPSPHQWPGWARAVPVGPTAHPHCPRHPPRSSVLPSTQILSFQETRPNWVNKGTAELCW